MCLAVVIGLGSVAMAVEIETVPVGNPGNAGDTEVMVQDGTTGYGSVSYTYNIGKYEVTAGQYTEFLNAVAVTDTYGLYNGNMWSQSYGCKIQRTGLSGSYSYSVASDWANRPVNYVSWGDSARFANWLHNNQPTGGQDLNTTEDGAYYLNGATSDGALLAFDRKDDWKWAITSEDEWYKAAYYDGDTGNYYDYPTGSNSAPGRDMTEATNPGNNANYAGTPYPIDSPYYTTVAGEFELSDSPYGTFDQGGNLWEWNEVIKPGGPWRGLRGGSFSNLGLGALHASSRYSGFPSYESGSIGFRVSEVPEPATMAILALGGIGMLRRRKCVQR